MDPSNGSVSVRRQCELLGVPRSSYYYRPSPAPAGPAAPGAEDVMAAVDEIHTDFPCYGARKVARELERRGFPGWSRRRVGRLMAEMGIRAVFPGPRTSGRRREDPRFPYLLRGKVARFPNQVWSSDITYVRCGRSHMYVYAVIDWFSRYVVAWDLLPDMGAEGVAATMRRAFEEHGTPGVANSDQGSVFGSGEYVGLLREAGVPQSMDGRGRWADNVIMERWFRTLKTECLRLAEYSTPAQLRRLIGEFVEQYNERRLHESLGYETPAEWYRSGIAEAA